MNYGNFLIIDNEGEGIVGQVSKLKNAINHCKRIEKTKKRNCTIAREVKW